MEKRFNLAELEKGYAEGLGAAAKGAELLNVVASFLPYGKAQKFLDYSKYGLIGAVANLLKKPVYSSQAKVLGQLFLYHLQGVYVKNAKDVPDDIIPIAQEFFTIAFGVRVRDNVDLDLLQTSALAYRASERGKDSSLQAAERAHLLKTKYFGNEKYLKQKFDMKVIADYEYVQPIPGESIGSLLNSNLPGMEVVNGLPVGFGGMAAPSPMPVDSVAGGGEFDNAKMLDAVVVTPKKSYVALILLGLALIVYMLTKKR